MLSLANRALEFLLASSGRTVRARRRCRSSRRVDRSSASCGSGRLSVPRAPPGTRARTGQQVCPRHLLLRYNSLMIADRFWLNSSSLMSPASWRLFRLRRRSEKLMPGAVGGSAVGAGNDRRGRNCRRWARLASSSMLDMFGIPNIQSPPASENTK